MIDGLRQVSDAEPGIRRRRRGDGFEYLRPDGTRVGESERRRIEALVIPPAWEDVWIARDPSGHIQATGRDARGRKQYIYHDEFRRAQDEDKFDRMLSFGAALPALRDALRADLAQDGLSRDRVAAAVIRIIEHSFARVGSDRYARDNDSYGICTVEDAHVERATSRSVLLRFRGKGDAEVEVHLVDTGVARVVGECMALPGRRLFQFLDDEGVRHPLDADDINTYLRETTGESFTAKDFRTWAATTLMTNELWHAEEDAPRMEGKEREVAVRRAVEAVAERLGNTPAVCKASYIHPCVPAAFLDGTLRRRIERDDGAEAASSASSLEGLLPEEVRTLALLRSYERPVHPDRSE